jgi:enoyl-CoA hydratase/carnithine racemase
MPDLLYEVRDRIATITLNRPDQLNALSGQMQADLRDRLAEADAAPDVRVIILTGAGRGFCAGADMTALSDLTASGALAEAPFEPIDPAVREDFQHVRTYFASVSKPIIAAVNGPAAGLGFAMLLFCDLRFASRDAVFVTSFSRRGLIAEHGSSWMLTRLVGHARAMDLLLSSRRVGTEEALRIGLVDRIADAPDLLRETYDYARDLADHVSPRSLRVIKRQLWDGLLQGLGPAMAIADAEMAASLTSEDFREGVAHFLEKRAPRFTGN